MEDINKEVVVVPEQKSVVLQGDPEEQLAYAKKASTALVQIIKGKPKPVMIGGEQYIEFEDWQTLARFYGASVGTEWTKPIEREGKVWGYEAKSNVMLKGELISSAEAMCTRDERNWRSRDEYMLRSMAQTRASAKALRNVFAWVVVMAGFKPTPAEEMDGVGQGDQLAVKTPYNAPQGQENRPMTIKNPNEPATDKQKEMIRSLASQTKTFTAVIEQSVGPIDQLTKGNASAVIERLMQKAKSAPAPEMPPLSENDGPIELPTDESIKERANENPNIQLPY